MASHAASTFSGISIRSNAKPRYPRSLSASTSSGAFSMPQMAETVPHSVRMRSTCGPNAWKYSSVAMAPFTNERLLRYDAGWPFALTSPETRGNQVWYRKRVGSAISSSYSARFMNAPCSSGSRYWNATSGPTSMPGTP